MQIKKKLQIHVVVSALTAVLICLMFYLLMDRISRAMEVATLADQIIINIFERSAFGEDYLRTGSERAKVQWFDRQAQIGRLLESAAETFKETERRKEIVAELIRNHETSEKLFSAIVKNREKTGGDEDSSALSREVESRLLTQLNLRLYDDTMQAGKLQEISRGLMFASLRQAGGGIAALLAIVIAAGLISSWNMSRIITKRIRRMCDGAAVIGTGDLTHRIDPQGNDEFVELAAEFNAMTAKLRSSYYELEKEIEERKRAEESLRRAKEVAEAATSAKSQFLANMSHELRTPMTGVLGMLELTLGTDLHEKQRDYLGIAHSSAQSLLRILNDILDLSKIEAGKVSINREPFILSSCVAVAIDLLAPEARRKGLQLDRVVADNLPEIVIGDQLRLKQVLINLIGNAVKFTEEGTISVHVAAGRVTNGGEHEVTISVTDSGIGIPPEKRHLLFDNFSQIDDSHTRRFGGTGLGLVISKKIIELMGGRISVTSEAGVGSTFAFTLPLGTVGAESHAAEVIVPPAWETTALAQQNDRIPRLLVAEDDPIVRDVLKELFFHRAKFDIDFAVDGQEAVEMWEAGSYDLLLMDIQMPRLNGFDATRAIREKERERGGHIPIVALTANAFKDDVERCFAAGMDNYLSKPIDFNKSLQLIEKILGLM